MTTKEEIIASIKATDPQILIEQLATKDSQLKIKHLDSTYSSQQHFPNELLVTVISQIPSSVWAQRADFEDIAADLLKVPHFEVLAAITERIIGMSIEEYKSQIEINPSQDNWITSFSNDRTLRSVYRADEYLEPLREYLRSIYHHDQVESFVGKPVENVTTVSVFEAVSKMDQQELIAALSDRERYVALTQIIGGDLGVKMAEVIAMVKPEEWPKGKALSDAFENMMNNKQPRVLEALIKVIKELPDETLLSQVEEVTQVNHLVEWSHSPDVITTAYGVPYLPQQDAFHGTLSGTIQDLTHLAQAKLEHAQLFGNIAPTPAPASTGLGATFSL